MVVALKFGVHYLQVYAQKLSSSHLVFAVLMPMVGVSLTVIIIRFLFKGNLDRGTSHILFAIARKGSRIPSKEIYGHPLTTTLTVGLGGSAGIEAPIVQTGAAIGSNIASYFPLGFKERTLLLACGAAAGIGAAFNAPIAGVLLALEVLLVDVTVSTFIPLLIAGAVGALCSTILSGEAILLSFPKISHFDHHNIPFYIILGICCGLSSVYYIRSMIFVQEKVRLVTKNAFGRIAIGCTVLGVAIAFVPGLYGEGMSAIRSLSSNEPLKLFNSKLIDFEGQHSALLIAVVVLSLVLLKPIATGLTIGTGGTGGNFAPSLFVGACLGFAVATLLQILGFSQVPLMNFCLVGMAGSLAGIFHSPLTAIFLIAELTGGYGLMIPLIAVAAISSGLAKYINPTSLDETILNKQMTGFSFDKDIQVLSHLDVKSLLETDFRTVTQEMPLRELVNIIANSKRNIFPVLDDSGGLKGIISLENIREKMFDQTLYDTIKTAQLMQPPVVKVSPNESMATVMEKFDKFSVWNIPVISDGKYIGFISKSKIFSSYRENLKT